MEKYLRSIQVRNCVLWTSWPNKSALFIRVLTDWQSQKSHPMVILREVYTQVKLWFRNVNRNSGFWMRLCASIEVTWDFNTYYAGRLTINVEYRSGTGEIICLILWLKLCCRKQSAIAENVPRYYCLVINFILHTILPGVLRRKTWTW